MPFPSNSKTFVYIAKTHSITLGSFSLKVRIDKIEQIGYDLDVTKKGEYKLCSPFTF